MAVSCHFKQMESSVFMREYVKAKLKNLMSRFDIGMVDTEVTFEPDGQRSIVRCHLRGDQLRVNVSNSSYHMLESVEGMATKLDEVLRRRTQKRKQRRRRGRARNQRTPVDFTSEDDGELQEDLAWNRVNN